jgi:hypothetical protein
LQRLGSDYGIEIIDHIPVGNLTSGDYLRTLALPLVSSITRLRQATETLREITEEEIDEEIQAKVAELKLAVRETDQVLREIKSMRQTLNDEENKAAIMQAREATIENAAQEEIAPAISLIESLQAQIRAKADSGQRDEHDRGHRAVQLRVGADSGRARNQAAGVRPAGRVRRRKWGERGRHSRGGRGPARAEIMGRLQTALDQISSESEISTERFSLDNVEARLEDISKDAEASLQEG